MMSTTLQSPMQVRTALTLKLLLLSCNVKASGSFLTDMKELHSGVKIYIHTCLSSTRRRLVTASYSFPNTTHDLCGQLMSAKLLKHELLKKTMSIFFPYA